MKNHFVVVLLLLMTCILSSCDIEIGGQNDVDDIPNVEPPTEPVEPTELHRPFISFYDFISPGTRTAALVMNSPDKDVEIYYTTDGSVPSKENGNEYFKNKRTVHCGSNFISAVPVSAGAIVRAVAYKEGNYSAVTTFEVPTEPNLDNPSIVIRGETSRGSVVVAMKTNDSSADIHFTTDGSIPTLDSPIYQNKKTTHILPGTKIVSGILVPHDTVVKAFANSTRYGLISDIVMLYIE